MKFFIITRKKLMLAICLVLGAAVAGAVGAYATSERLLPIYCVETDKKQIAISFDAAWGDNKKVQNVFMLILQT